MKNIFGQQSWHSLLQIVSLYQQVPETRGRHGFRIFQNSFMIPYLGTSSVELEILNSNYLSVTNLESENQGVMISADQNIRDEIIYPK